MKSNKIKELIFIAGRIYGILKKMNALGAENAVPRRVVLERLSARLSDRKMREAKEYGFQNGVDVLSCSKSYFIPVKRSDYKVFIDHEKSAIAGRVRGIEIAQERSDTCQVSLF